MEVGLRVPLDRRGQRTGTVVLPARLLLDVVRALPGRPSRSSCAPERAGRRARRRPRDVPPPHAARRGLPALPEPGGDARWSRCPPAAFVETIARVARSASRDETRPILTGILVSARAGAADGRHRLLPPGVKETHARVAAGRRRSRPTCRRGRSQELARARPARRRRAIAHRRARQPGRVRGRRRDAVLAPDRRPVPELPPAAARAASSTSCASTRAELGDVVERIASWRRRTRRCGSRFTEGELTVSAQTPDVGEAREPLPVPFAGEPFEIGFNPEFLRDGLESVGSERGRPEADQPAAAGPDRGRRRQRLPLPDHADPAERLGVDGLP